MRRISIWMLLCLLLLWHGMAGAEERMLLGPGSTCMIAVAEDGSIWGWGENGNGQLGLGSKKSPLQPVRTAENLDGQHVVKVRGGKAHMLFLMDDGTMYACGHNQEGQLGLGETGKDVTIPAQIPGLSHIVDFAVGHQHSLALDAEGHVWAWGHNDCGQVGDGTRKNQPEPFRLPLEDIEEIACGRKFSLARAKDGTIYGWGDNAYGQLGDINRLKSVYAPEILPMSGRFHSLTCGNASCFALDAEGKVWAWGRNDYWQLGDSSASERTTEPVMVQFPESFSVKTMDGFNIHTALLTQEGAVWQWGACGHGQYGLGKRPWRTLPIEACPAQGVISIAVNTYTSYILTAYGEVYASGGNWYGQAGTEDRISHYVMEWTDTGLNLMASVWENPQS